MPEDPSSKRRGLWSDSAIWDERRARQLEDARVRAAQESERRAAADRAAAEEARRAARRAPRKIVATFAVLAVAILAGGGVIAGSLLLGDDGGPADTGAPLVQGPGGGETRAGRVYTAASPGVVSVQAQRAGGRATGTGFVVGDDGTIVTNAHVVGTATSATVLFGDDGDEVSARVRGTDPSSDLAVLRIDPGETDRLTSLPLADSRDVRVGDDVVAIGSPFGLDRTATAGIVSSLGREITAPNGFQIDQVIQTDAPINPGNSGGPLLDRSGRVVGVNSQIATGGANGNVGVGFAVPSNTLRSVLPRLRRGEQIRRAYLGVSSETSPGGGARVSELVEGGPADRAGLREGDVILSIGGREVDEPGDVSAAIKSASPGDDVELDVRSGGISRKVDAKLGTQPQRSP